MASSSARGGFAPGTAQVAAATVVPCDGLVQGLPFEGVEATAERAGLVEAVEQAGGEGVARADGVDDVDLRIRVAAADAVVRDEGARPAGVTATSGTPARWRGHASTTCRSPRSWGPA